MLPLLDRVTISSLMLSGLAMIGMQPSLALAQTVQVSDAAGLKTALGRLVDGMTLQLAAGDYPGNHAVKNIKNLTIEGTDPFRPPQFHGGGSAWHFSGCSGLKIRHLRVSGQTGNGMNFDDGGEADQPMSNVTIEHVDISDIGPKGNTDAIKCSGLDELTIRHCSVAGWGGQAIDLVGCHRVGISSCKISGKQGFTQDSGIQCKGGSDQVTIERCEFNNAGQRPINAGGSTGMAYFRPRGVKYEARRVVIRDNVITGSSCACAFVGVDGAEFTSNTILFPEKWIFRILQETNEAGFAPCRNVTIENNSIVFRRSQISTEVNVGANTEPQTFKFARNRWFAEDRPDRSRPKLPNDESDGTYGVDPRG